MPAYDIVWSSGAVLALLLMIAAVVSLGRRAGRMPLTSSLLWFLVIVLLPVLRALTWFVVAAPTTQLDADGRATPPKN